MYLYLIRDNRILKTLWLGGTTVADAIYESEDKQVKKLEIDTIVSFNVTKDAILKMHREGVINYVDSPSIEDIRILDDNCFWEVVID